MALGIGLLVGVAFVVWLVFFKFRWLQWSIPWAIFSSLAVIHVFLIFFIGLRFVTPASNNAKVVQHTIQLVPRLTEPTSVTEVLVEENQHVTKASRSSASTAAPMNTRSTNSKPDWQRRNRMCWCSRPMSASSEQNLAKAKSELVFAQYQQQLAQGLAASMPARKRTLRSGPRS